MLIASAQPDDIPKLCLLLSELFNQEAEFAADSSKQSLGLRLIINNPDIGNIFIARQQDNIIGMVSLLYSVSTALGGKVAILEDMIVTQSQRKQGIGNQLIETAIAHARQQGCLRITLLTDADNKSAHSFYARYGFNNSNMQTLRLHLTP